MQAIILAGGSGATLRPLTQRNPRSLVPLVNKPLIAHQIDLLARCGVNDVVVCVDTQAERFERYFAEAAAALHEQGVRVRLHCDETPRGTAGAVKSAEPLLNLSLNEGLGGSDENAGAGADADVLVLNGDILFDVSVADLVAFHRERGAAATLCLSANSDPGRYGVVLTDTSGRVQQFIEKPGLRDEAPTDTINGGIYVFNRSVFQLIPTDAPTYSLERSVFPALLRAGAPVYGLVSSGYWQDITTLTDYRKAQEDLLCGRVQGRAPGGQREGESFWVGHGSSVHPTAEITGPVALGKNVMIGRNVRIRGPVSIGAGCRIEDDAVIDRSILWRGSVVERGATVRGCILGDDCTVKEGAAVQEGSVLGDGAVVASYLASLAQAEQAAKKAKIRFGTDGWRGIIADDFTGENVRLVTQSIVDMLREPTSPGEPAVVIGYDNRSQSDYFAGEVAKIVAANGLKAVLSDRPCSSPSVSYLTRYLRARGGIMVTASHNPPSFNGLKIKAYYGGSASPEMVGRVETHLHRLIDAGAVPEGLGESEMAHALERRDLSEAYLSHCASLVDLESIKAAGQKIVIDAMYGSGAGYLPRVLRQAGIDNFVEIRNERNPIFGGISPEPTPQNLGALAEAVVEHGAAVGIALDGDADRVGAMDSEGRFVDSHRIFAVLLMHLVERRGWSGGVVKTVSTTKMIDKLCAKYDLALHETPIGFKHICDLMLRENILIGGEESGGIGVKNHLPERDGVLMGLLLLEAMASRGKSLGELVEEVFAITGRREYSRVDLHPRSSRMHTIISALQSYHPDEITGRRVAEISRRDGTKFTFEGESESWLMLRPSGTEPVVRVYAEGVDMAEVDALIAAGIQVVDEA